MIDIPNFQEIIDFVTVQIKNNEFFATAGFFGILGIIWQYAKGFPKYLWSRIKRRIRYSVSIYETDPFYEYFENWLKINYKETYRNVEAKLEYNDLGEGKIPKNDRIVTKHEVATTSAVKEEISYRQFLDSFYIRRKFRFLKIFKGRDKLENANSLQNAFLNRFEISGIFSTRSINKLMSDVLQYNIQQQEKNKNTKIRILTNSSHNWRRMDDVNPKPISKMILNGKDDMVKDIENFLNNKVWYEDRSILHKRGYLLYGKPGNGKTSLTMAIAKHFDKDLYFLNPSDVTDEQLTNLYGDLKPKSILVIEDIDSIFNKKREKEDRTVKFNFSTLLNCLDGAFSKEGIITIFTTNHPERLDDALIRTGRMDYKFEITNPSKSKIEEYLLIFFNKKKCSIDSYGDNNTLPMVRIQDICIRNKDNYIKAKKEIEFQLLSDLVTLNGKTKKETIIELK